MLNANRAGSDPEKYLSMQLILIMQVSFLV